MASHRDKLRGVFFINLESIGAGRLSVVTVEGEQQLFKGDRRIMNLVSKVCKSFHVDCGAFEMPYAKTDASAALEASRRALTIAGVDGPRLPALAPRMTCRTTSIRPISLRCPRS